LRIWNDGVSHNDYCGMPSPISQPPCIGSDHDHPQQNSQQANYRTPRRKHQRQIFIRLSD
jgi:hypothetical protein